MQIAESMPSALCTIALRSDLNAYALHGSGFNKFKSSSQGHQHTLTVIDRLMSYTWCITLYTNDADEVVHAYLVHEYSKFCRSHKICQIMVLSSRIHCSWNLLPIWEWNRYLVPFIILKATGTLKMYISFWRHAYRSMSPLNLDGIKWLI